MRAITDEEKAAVASAPHRDSIQSIVIHASYLLNFAKILSKERYEMKSLVEDITNSEQLGGDGAVLHMGKMLKELPEVAEKLFIEHIKEAVEKTDGMKSAVILENTAGQGTEMGWQLTDYGRIFHALKKEKRVRCCIDTAHLMGAGYNLHEASGVEKTIKELEEHVGFSHIACIHFNDSKKEAGTRVDRHQDIGHGTIGLEGLRLFATEVFKRGPTIPLILETPEEHIPYSEQINIVRSWF